MKKPFITIVCTLIAYALHAQITIDSSSFASWTPYTDVTYGTGSTPPVPGNNISSGISIVPFGRGGMIPAYYQRSPYVNALFPNTAYALEYQDVIYSCSFSPNTWSVFENFGILNNGIVAYGQTIDYQPDHASWMANPLNAATDSFIIPAQTAIYSSAYVLLKFPLTTGTAWSNDFSYTTHGTLNLAAQSINNVQVSKFTHIITYDTVVGWGKIRIVSFGGVTTDSIDIIGVKSYRSAYDDIQTNPPSSTPVTYGNPLTSGYYKIKWFRKGEITPLVTVWYDNTFSQWMHVEVHADRLPIATGISAINGNSQLIKAYPNPVTAGNDIQIQLTEGSGGQWTCQLINSAGQVVSSTGFDVSHDHGQIHTNSTLPAGSYYLNLYNGQQKATTTPVLIRN